MSFFMTSDMLKEMHLSRVVHHKGKIGDRIPYLILFASVAAVFGTIDGRIESIALLGFGAGFGAVLTSTVHHIRKERFHMRMASFFDGKRADHGPHMSGNPRDYMRVV